MRNHTANSRRSRVVTTIIATVVAVAAFASFGGIGLAHGVINLAQYQYGKKITICHKQKRTITVSVNAWPAHQRHGDTVGPCQAVPAAAKKGQQPSGTQGGKGKGKSQGGKGSSSSSNQPSGGSNGNGKGKSK
jgi:uncharacterized membrane protein YgcG